MLYVFTHTYPPVGGGHILKYNTEVKEASIDRNMLLDHMMMELHAGLLRQDRESVHIRDGDGPLTQEVFIFTGSQVYAQARLIWHFGIMAAGRRKSCTTKTV